MKLINDIVFYERFMELYLNLPKGCLKNKIKILKYEKNEIVILVDKIEVTISIKKDT